MGHQVSFTVPARPVGNKDIEFAIKRDVAALGSLKVSQAGIVWRPRDAHFGYFLSWSKLGKVAEEQGTSRAL